MKLKAIVATATSEAEANLIFAEIAKTHAFIEFFKIDSRQVTVIYEPEQSRFDRINIEAEELRASLPAVEKSAMIKKPSVGIEDLEAKLCELGLDKDYLVTASAWSASKPQWYEVYHKWPSIKPIVIRSNSVDVVSCKLLEISDERQALMMPEIEKTETEEEKSELPPIKKSADRLTIVDLETKVKKLGLEEYLFIRVTNWESDKPQEYTIYDDSNGWTTFKPIIFKSKSAIAVSRQLTKIHKERQAVKVGHSLAVNPSQPIDIQKVCPHCDQPLGKDQICSAYHCQTAARSR